MPERSVVTTPAVSTASGSSSTWTFTQGFILGQASFLLIVLVFVRYVVFQAAEELDEAGHKKRRLEKANRTKLSTTSVPAPPASHVLGKTSYEMATHPAESSDWLNVLIAQVLQGYRNDLLSDGGEEGARQRIEQWLNPDGGSMSWLDPIQVTGLSLGSAYPLLSNARIRPADGKGHIRAEIDIDYMDSLSLSLSTSVLINFPRPRFAVLPVALGVELVSIGGTLSLEIHDPHGERQHLHACLLPDFHLNLKTTTLLGSRAKLQDIPKLEQLILSRFRAALQDRLVHPHHLTLALPRLMSASTSPTPLINDIGEGAVHAMNDALRKGVSQMVEDVIGAPNDDETHDIDSRWTSVAPSLQGSTADLRQKEINDAQRPKDSIRSTKRIPMPAGFPGYPTISAENSVPSTPATEDKYARPAPISTLNSYNTPRPTASTRNSTQRIPPYGTSSQYASSAAAAAPSVSQDSGHFRFRGQFASQPPTPGVDAPRREGRSGALNAR